MRVLLPVVDDPDRLVPLWPALSDAARAVPGIELQVLGTPRACALMRHHPDVATCIAFDGRDLRAPVWHPRRWQARRALRRLLAERGLDAADAWDRIIDPYGTRETVAMVRRLKGRKLGLAGVSLAEPSLSRAYDSTFPIPDALHPVQAHRVLLAAILDYSIHDLGPEYGLNVAAGEGKPACDLLFDLRAVPWGDEQKAQMRLKLQQSALSVEEIGDDPADEADLFDRVLHARYLLSGPNVTGWLGAALGQYGLCVCPENQANSVGVISTRRAVQKIINVDHPPLNQPEIVIESILQVLSRLKQASDTEGAEAR